MPNRNQAASGIPQSSRFLKVIFFFLSAFIANMSVFCLANFGSLAFRFLPETGSR